MTVEVQAVITVVFSLISFISTIWWIQIYKADQKGYCAGLGSLMAIGLFGIPNLLMWLIYFIIY